MRKTIQTEAYRRLIGRLADRRRQLRLHQEDVARTLGVARSWVGKVEQCDLRLDVVQLSRLCRCYGLKAWRLVREMEDELPDEGSSSANT